VSAPCAQRDSNPHSQVRSLVPYPLNDGRVYRESPFPNRTGSARTLGSLAICQPDLPVGAGGNLRVTQLVVLPLYR
jgi:hypothetical protein